jgi:uncharacterized membrane protein YhfC
MPISGLNLLSGIGMIAVGAGAMVYWHLKYRTGLKYFLLGGILWAIAIGIKLVMDLTITQPIQSGLLADFPVFTVIVIMSLYLGLRTGFLESGITYLVVKHTSLASSGYKEAVALGIGFGGAEAIVLGISSLASVLALLLSPALQGTLTPSILAQFAPAFIPIPVIERVFTLFIHVFAVVLVVYAVRCGQLRWLWLSIFLKTITDGALPLFAYYFTAPGIRSLLPVEGYIAVLGIICLAGLYVIQERFNELPVIPELE